MCYELKEANTFIDPTQMFLSYDDHRFHTMGDIPNQNRLISEYFIIIIIVNIENDISDGYDTNAEEKEEMGENTKEFRDPIYNFIHITPYEKKIIDSDYFQRLRYIHQLGMTYFVYPGAQHTRFDHSLGTMEIATKLFDVIKNKKFKDKPVLKRIFHNRSKEMDNYRQMLRIACLLHDIGHYPFSHAVESKTIWDKDHEERGIEIILKSEIKDIIEDNCPKDMNITAEDISYLITDKPSMKIPTAQLQLLNQIITKDLGVDRIDYLIRDSLHTGVKYGIFDYYRLVDSFILCEDENIKPRLCLEKGGIHAAEGLILARYWIFLQVYYHKTRVAYDFHLGDYTKNFVKYWKNKKKNKVDYTKLENFLELNDFTLLNSIKEDYNKKYNWKKCKMAKKIMKREHHKRNIEIDGNIIDPKHFSEDKKQWEISKIVYDELKGEIENDYYDEIKKGKILFWKKLKNTHKFHEDIFYIYDNGKLDNILNQSKLIGKLMNIDLFRVYTDYGEKKVIEEVEKIGDGIKKRYYKTEIGGVA